MDVEIQGFREFVPEIAPEAAMLRIDPAQQLTLVPAEADRVIAVSGARLPGRRLLRQERGQAIEIREDLDIERFVDRGQARLVSQ